MAQTLTQPNNSSALSIRPQRKAANPSSLTLPFVPLPATARPRPCAPPPPAPSARRPPRPAVRHQSATPRPAAPRPPVSSRQPVLHPAAVPGLLAAVLLGWPAGRLGRRQTADGRRGSSSRLAPWARGKSAGRKPWPAGAPGHQRLAASHCPNLTGNFFFPET